MVDLEEFPELAMLRGVGADVTDPDPIAVRRARRRLLGAAVGPRVAARRQRRLRLGVVAAAVLVVMAGMVWSEAFRHDQRTGKVAASAAAVAVLEKAAQASLNAHDPVVEPGQFLRITTREYNTFDTEVRAGEMARIGYRSTDALYVPADRSDEWVWVRGPMRSQRLLSGDLDLDEVRVRTNAEIVRATQGEFYGPIEPGWQQPTPEWLATLPTSIPELRERLYRDAGDAGPSPDGEVVVLISDALRTGRVPAPERARLFEVATTIPGLTVVDDAVVMDGRQGIALGRVEALSGVSTELVFDSATGLLIGERKVSVDDSSGMPAGEVWSESAVTTDVVNQAP